MTQVKISGKIQSIKNQRGRVQGYTAHCRSLGTATTRDTKDEALADLSALVAFRCEDQSSHVNVLPIRGHVAVISYNLFGGVDIQYVWPDGHVSATGGYRSFHEAEDSFRLNVAQLTWDGTLTEPDILPSTMQREFRSWAEFQLRYRYARKEQGADDRAAYLYASDSSNPYRASVA